MIIDSLECVKNKKDRKKKQSEHWVLGWRVLFSHDIDILVFYFFFFLKNVFGWTTNKE